MRENSKKLSSMEVFALSIATVAPTGAMAFNTTTSAKFAGVNIPLSFLLGAVAILLIGFCFVELAKNVTGEGSVYAYNRRALGERAGFLTGWALTLTYICFAAGTVGLTADFGNVLLNHFGIHIPIAIIAIFFILLGWFITFFGLQSTSRIALVMEMISICILLILSLIIIFSGGKSGNSITPFLVKGNTSGIGQGMIFAILCFAGFEGSSTIAGQSSNPKRSIPFAILSTIIGAAAFYLIVSYAQVIGFGVSNISKLASSSAPLDYLGVIYMGNSMATIIDFATLMSCFAAFLGSVNACAYMLFALSGKQYLPKYLSKFDLKLSSPKNAVNTTSIVCIFLYILIGIPFGPEEIYASLAEIGAVSLLIVYLLVCLGTIFYFKNVSKEHFSVPRHLIVPIVGFVILLFPLWTNLYPVPKFPSNLYPYIVALWIIIGWVISLFNHPKNDLFSSPIDIKN